MNIHISVNITIRNTFISCNEVAISKYLIYSNNKINTSTKLRIFFTQMKHSWNHIIFRFIPCFFFCLVQIDLRSGVLHAFFPRRQEKKVPFCNQSFFAISPVRSNPFPQFFTGSFAVDFGDHLRSRIIGGPFLRAFAVSGSFAVLYSCSPIAYR